jgi:hypothetical protein
MFRRIRTSTWIRAVLCAAAFAALANAFGFHPEPVRAEAVAAHRGLASAHVDDPPHSCIACLTHVTVLLRPAGALVHAVQQSAPDSHFATTTACGRVAGRDLSGRSPPAGS